MQVHKLNESYSVIDSDTSTLRNIFDFLRVLRPGAYFDPMVKSGFKSPYEYFGSIQNKKLLVMNGHLQLLGNFGVNTENASSEYEESDIEKFLREIKTVLPFEPYDFQEKAIVGCLKNPKQLALLATSSGKSLVISVMAEFLRRMGKRGLLLVPNTSLLFQFKSDIKSYNLQELHDNTRLIGDKFKEKKIDTALTISTWQSMMKVSPEELEGLDYIIGDEVHRLAAEVSSGIIQNTVNCKYKWGFTGTLPEDPVMKMQLFGLFGLPERYVRSSELIERGLATPVNIKPIILNYSDADKRIFKHVGNYTKQLKFIKDHEKRQELLVNICLKMKGNTLVLGQHTEHLKSIFIDIMKAKYPDVEVKNKDITGKKSFEFQEKYGIYFLNGEDNADTREKTRKIIEEHETSITVSNFAIMSTGTNIKRLNNLVLGSPMKSYNTITQSIGRLMRLHPDKPEANIIDIVDNFGFRKPSGIFYKQYQHRKNTSYNPEGFPINEIEYNL